MPCAHANLGEGESRGLDRREFMKAAVAIGGASALSAVKARAHGDDGHSETIPTGRDDPTTLPERHYAWDDFCSVNGATGLAKTPQHHLMLLADYEGGDEDDGFLGHFPFGDDDDRGRGKGRGRDDDHGGGGATPTDEDREQVEQAFRTLERAFEWGNEGLLFTVGYSPSYFDRFEEDLPEGTGLVRPEEVIDEVDIRRSGRVVADDFDVHIHLASDNALALLEAEQALRGRLDEVNGEPVAASLDGVLDVRDRRTGFIGNPHEMWDREIPGRNPVAEEASVWFGLKSLFTDSQPSEAQVAISDPDHPFHNGTTEQASILQDTEVRNWYRIHDHEERVQRMYSPHHTSEDAGQHGRELAPTSGTENRREDGVTMNEAAELTKQDAEEKQVVGHAQKLARARKGEDNVPPLLRRDFPSTDGIQPKTQFISNQRTIDDFIDVRRAMSFVNHEDDDPNAAEEVPIKDHGIQGFLRTIRRGTFLVPPRSLRALPPAQP